MEFVTLSFEEILALQNIENKDEEEDPVVVKKTSGRRKPTNKGARAAQKKAKMASKAVAKNHGYLHKEGEDFYEINYLSFVDGSTLGRVVGNEYRKISPQELAHKANERRWGWETYDHLCKEEIAKKSERRVERAEERAERVLLESAGDIRQALKNAEDNLGYAQYMLNWAEERLAELEANLNWLQFKSAETMTVKEAYEEYSAAILRRDDFIPQVAEWRALYDRELSAYDQAKADYDMLPFWL